MKLFQTSNGLTMVKCEPLNFRVEQKYRDDPNSHIYMITCGNIAEMHSGVYNPEENRLTIANMVYSSDEVTKFYCTTFEQASTIMYSFGLGHYGKDAYKDTIYVDK